MRRLPRRALSARLAFGGAGWIVVLRCSIWPLRNNGNCLGAMPTSAWAWEGRHAHADVGMAPSAGACVAHQSLGPEERARVSLRHAAVPDGYAGPELGRLRAPVRQGGAARA